MFVYQLIYKQKLYEQIQPHSLLKGRVNFNKVEATSILTKLDHLSELYSALQIFFMSILC